MNESTQELLRATCGVVSSYLGHNQVRPDTIGDLVRSVHAALKDAASDTPEKKPGNTTPAVQIKKSVTDEHIICLEDGKKLKMLKRYLRTHYGMSPSEYRRKWALPPDYPMVAPAYARQRSDFAKFIGLGKAKPPTKTSRKK